jgi:hypothetical protein
MEKVINFFKKFWFPNKVDYKAKYEYQKEVAKQWEYRYNKIYRLVKELSEEIDN